VIKGPRYIYVDKLALSEEYDLFGSNNGFQSYSMGFTISTYMEAVKTAEAIALLGGSELYGGPKEMAAFIEKERKAAREFDNRSNA